MTSYTSVLDFQLFLRSSLHLSCCASGLTHCCGEVFWGTVTSFFVLQFSQKKEHTAHCDVQNHLVSAKILFIPFKLFSCDSAK